MGTRVEGPGLRPLAAARHFGLAMEISYVDGPRLRRSLLAAGEYARLRRADLNRINVFPVPDGDTGTNLALTVGAISDELRRSRHQGVSEVAREAARAAVLGARGNCGMMLSHFLLGFADCIEGRTRIGAGELAEAFQAGAERLQDALERPVEGTILTVVRDTARAATRASTVDVAALMTEVVERARESLARTPDLLPVLRKAGVVDAGAKGFVHLLEGVVAYMRGDAELPDASGEDVRERGADGRGAVGMGVEVDGEPAGVDDGWAAARADFPDEHGSGRFCTEALVRGPDLPDQASVRDRLRDRGDSLIVIRTEDALKVHLHTDEPEEVFADLRTLGRLVTHKAEDLRAQHRSMERAAKRHVRLARRPVGIVTDSGCDLPDEVIRAHGIRVVPLQLVDGDRTYRDREDLTAEAFARRMAEDEELPTTSQPPPGDFLEAFEDAAGDAEELVAVILASALSGTHASAEAVAGLVEEATVHVVDSRGASLLQGLLVLKAAELAESGAPPGRIVEELDRIRGQSGILFTVDRFDRLRASGRVGKGTAWLGSLLGVKPIFALDSEGSVSREGLSLGRKRVLPAVMRRLEETIPDGAERVRFGVVHVGCPDTVEEVSAALHDRWGEVEVLTGSATPVIATHIGLGAWAVAYLVED